jgi:hypothetical protein
MAGDMLKTVKGPLQVIDPHVLPAEVHATPQTRRPRLLAAVWTFQLLTFDF